MSRREKERNIFVGVRLQKYANDYIIMYIKFVRKLKLPTKHVTLILLYRVYIMSVSGKSGV